MLRRLLLLAVMALAAMLLAAPSALAGGFQAELGGNPYTGDVEAELETEDGELDGFDPNVNLFCEEAHIDGRITDAGGPTVEGVAGEAGDEVEFHNHGVETCNEDFLGTNCHVDVLSSPDDLHVRQDDLKSEGQAELVIEDVSFEFECAGGLVHCVYDGSVEGKVDALGDPQSHEQPHATFPGNPGDSASHVPLEEGTSLCPSEGVLRGEVELVEPEGLHLVAL